MAAKKTAKAAKSKPAAKVKKAAPPPLAKRPPKPQKHALTQKVQKTEKVEKAEKGEKTSFNKGDFVVAPMRGVGTISDITTLTVLGKKKKYYIVDLFNIKMQVNVPVDKAEEIGLRHIIAKKDVTKVLNLLKEDYIEQDEDWKIRYQNNLTKVKSGSILEVGEVTRNLYKRARDKELSIMERKLYETAYSLVIHEIALARNLKVEEASNLISDILSN